MSYFLGVDAGGTKTEFVLGDDERELARVRAGSIKRMRVSAEEAESNLRQAAGELELSTGVALSTVAHCCIGAAGNTVPMVRDWLLKYVPLHVGGGLTVVNDVEIALDAAFAGGSGILVLAGTGSNVAGRSEEGVIVTAGGWGPALADQGSGHSLGLHALRRLFLAMDQQRSSSLLDTVLASWHLNSIAELVAYANRHPSPDFSQLAPLVARAAEQGDSVAMETIELEASELAELVVLVLERLREMDGPSLTVPRIAYTGSVISHVHLMRQAVLRAVTSVYPSVDMLDAPADPPLGALWRARRECKAVSRVSA